MTPDQQLRNAGIQAAAAFCGRLGPVGSSVSEGGQGQHIVPPETVLAVADFFTQYISNGTEQALAWFKGTQEQPTADPEPVQAVELREDSAPPKVADEPQRATVEQQKAAPAGQSSQAVADVIPLAARGTVSKEQMKARSLIDERKRKVAAQFLKMAKVAKTDEHKARLVEEAQSRGVADFVMEIDGVERGLGDYLASL